MISVIMPVYGRKDMIEYALMSYCSQKADSELIIVDDDSPEDMFPVIEKYMAKDNRIKYLKNTINRGQSFSNNRAMENSSGDNIIIHKFGHETYIRVNNDDPWNAYIIQEDT